MQKVEKKKKARKEPDWAEQTRHRESSHISKFTRFTERQIILNAAQGSCLQHVVKLCTLSDRLFIFLGRAYCFGSQLR